MQLAQSPLVKQPAAATHAALHEREDLAAITPSRRQQRTRDYMQRNNVNRDASNAELGDLKNKNSVVVVGPVPAAAARRRPVGRAAERSSISRRNVANNKFMDAASWRGQAPRHMEAQPVSLVV